MVGPVESGTSHDFGSRLTAGWTVATLGKREEWAGEFGNMAHRKHKQMRTYLLEERKREE